MIKREGDQLIWIPHSTSDRIIDHGMCAGRQKMHRQHAINDVLCKWKDMWLYGWQFNKTDYAFGIIAIAIAVVFLIVLI